MSDVIFYACGHTIAQRNIRGAFTVNIEGDESPLMCPLCRDGRTTPHDTNSMTKDELILGVIRGNKCKEWDNTSFEPVADIKRVAKELQKDAFEK